MKNVLLLSAVVALMAMTGCSENKEESKAVSFDEVLTSRRSVRSYDATKKISEAEVRELLTATQEAPSWANQQPTKYYVAISNEKLAAVQDLVGGNKERIQNAPVLIVSTFERGKSGFFQGNQTNEVGDGWGAYDNGLSNCYLILKARAMGFDTLIMGMRDADGLRTLFEIPENETIMAVISLGYRAGEPTRPERRPLDDIVKFYENTTLDCVAFGSRPLKLLSEAVDVVYTLLHAGHNVCHLVIGETMNAFGEDLSEATDDVEGCTDLVVHVLYEGCFATVGL